jgi:hypothetical protein
VTPLQGRTTEGTESTESIKRTQRKENRFFTDLREDLLYMLVSRKGSEARGHLARCDQDSKNVRACSPKSNRFETLREKAERGCHACVASENRWRIAEEKTPLRTPTYICLFNQIIRLDG